MKLSELLSSLLAETPLRVELREDFDLQSPEGLMHPEVHEGIGDAVAEAAMAQNLSVRGAYAFAEWLAELVTGWSTRFSNENDVLHLDAVFGKAAYGSPSQTIRLYLLPAWDALSEHLSQVRQGVQAVFEVAKTL